MRYRFFLIFYCFFLFVIELQGQERLSESNFSGDSIYIYRLNREDLNQIYRKEKEPNESNLHTLITRYPCNGHIPELPRGNYMLVQAQKNALKYDSYIVDDLKYNILSGDDLLLYLSDSCGVPITQAMVKLDRRILRYDTEMKVYMAKSYRKERLLEIENKGVYHYILLNAGNPIRSSHKKKFGEKGLQSEFASFIVYSKPKYKPGEQVKFKAFLQSPKGKRIDEPIEVRLQGLHVDTLLTTLTPYRPGFYNYEFPLSDGIKWVLDRSYWVELRSAKTQKVYLTREFFRIEEYELKGIQFNCRANNQVHQRQNPPSISLEITDENEMAVLDGNCRITVRPQGNYTYLQEKGFIPDQLWETSFSWTGERKKEIVLPDSIYPFGVSFNYIVNCVYLTPDNERHEKNLYLNYDGRESMIRFTPTHEGVLVEQITNGRTDTTMAQVKGGDQNNKIISTRAVQLPFLQRWGEHVSFYSVKSAKAEGTCWKPDQHPVSCQLRKERDSLWVTIHNPYEYPCWYRLYQDKKMVEKGTAKQLHRVRKIKEKSNYYLQVDYLIGGEIKHLNQEVLVQEKEMDIRLQMPEIIFPGQTTQVELEVLDYRGNPVSDVDVTASAISSKFGWIPFRTPFPWTESQKPELNSSFMIRSKELHHQAPMNWERWREEMNLDKELAYQFMYPNSLFRTEEPGRGGITQLAPFAFVDGEMQTVYLLEVDGLPYYYYQSEHLGGYSFPVTPGKHQLTLHLYDRKVRLQEFEVHKGMKNIVSLEVTDSAPEIGLTVELKPKKQQGIWTEAERRLLNQHLFRVWDNFKDKRLDGLKKNMRDPAYFYAEPFIYPLTKQEFSSGSFNTRGIKGWLVGPFPDWRPLSLYVGGEKIHEFLVEGGNQYVIRKNYLKLREEELVPETWTETTPEFDLKAFVTSPKEIERQCEEGVREEIKRFWRKWCITDHFKDTVVFAQKTYRLRINLKKSQDAKDHYLTLFYHADQNVWQIYTGVVTYFNDLLSPNPKMILVFDKDRCDQCQLDLKANGVNYRVFDSVAMKPQTPEFSQWLQHCIQHKIINSQEPQELLPVEQEDSLKLQEGEVPVSIRVYDALLGEPLSGCSVRDGQGKHKGVTNGQGWVTLSVPLGTEIHCSIVGCKSQTIKVVRGGRYDLFLENLPIREGMAITTGISLKNEGKPLFYMKGGAVLGQRKRSVSDELGMTDADNFANNDFAETEKGLKGVTMGEMRNRVSMILLNGQPYGGSIEDINANTIVSIKVLSAEKGLELFGEQGKNGVLVITTSASEEESDAGKTLRRNFRDDAFWEPALRTDEKGKVSFSVTWPDDITSWNLRFWAIDEKSRFGDLTTMIKSFKSLSARLSVPRFVLEGDSTHLIGKINNYVGDTLSVKRQFSVNGERLEQSFSFFTSHVDTLPIRVASGDSLHLQYSMHQENGFFDGEERVIPVLKQGIKESHGVFQVLQTDSLYRFRLNPLLGEVTVYAETTPLELLLREIEQIEHYPYACNEQNASKLKALLLKKRVCQLLKKPFKEEKKIKKLIADLEKNQNGDGLWGWWGKQETEEWISMQVFEALFAAKQGGYIVKINRQTLVQKMVRHLQNVSADLKDFPNARLGCLIRLAMLKALDEPLDYSLFFQRIVQGTWHTLYEELWALRVKQLIGLPVSENEILRFAQKSILGGLYWEKAQNHEKDRSNDEHLPQDNRIQNTLLAYQLLRDLDGHEQELQQIRNYFFEMRRSGHWNNMYDASRILEIVFAEELFDKRSLDAMQMEINGEKITQFPFTRKYKAGEELEVQKWGTSPIYFTAYQESWNHTPISQSNGFQVQTYFRKELKSANGFLAPKEERIEELKAGEPVELVVQVQPEKDAHYVMVEVPIPAGCSYESKSQSRWKETHREYRKEKASIFCRYLQHDSKNPAVFIVKLIPRFSGRYHLNPASVELMYFPTFNGREKIKKVPIH